MFRVKREKKVRFVSLLRHGHQANLWLHWEQFPPWFLYILFFQGRDSFSFSSSFFFFFFSLNIPLEKLQLMLAEHKKHVSSLCPGAVMSQRGRVETASVPGDAGATGAQALKRRDETQLWSAETSLLNSVPSHSFSFQISKVSLICLLKKLSA